MIPRITALFIAGLAIAMAAQVPAIADQSQARESKDDAAELKAVQAERIKVLTQAVDVLTAQYMVGTVDFCQVAAAETDLCNALLDSTDDPDKRTALLAKQLDRATGILKVTQSRFDAGTVTQADVLRAKSHQLDIKIKLLRNRKKPLCPPRTRRRQDGVTASAYRSRRRRCVCPRTGGLLALTSW